MSNFIALLIMMFFVILMRNADKIAHLLNNFFNLPHPGPNSIVGSCSCRKHEGKSKYQFNDYLRYLSGNLKIPQTDK